MCGAAVFDYANLVPTNGDITMKFPERERERGGGGGGGGGVIL